VSEVTNIGLLFDGVISILLLITIIYAVVLNKKLNLIRDGKQDMETLVWNFTEAVKQAEQGLNAVRAAAQEGGEALQTRTEAADRLADDLAFLMKKGDITISKLEEIIKRSRNPLYRSPSQQDPDQRGAPGPGTQRPERQAHDIGSIEPSGGASHPGEPADPHFGRQSQPEKAETAAQSDKGKRTITGAVPGSLPLREGDGDCSPPAQRASQGGDRPGLSTEESQLLKILQGMR